MAADAPPQTPTREEPNMLYAMTARRLKPGAYEDYLAAWTLDAPPPGWTRICTVRSVEDEDEVVSFGFFDGSMEDLRRSQEQFDYAAQRARVEELVQTTHADGIYEVKVELEGGG
jgi:hypothetical protein